MNNIDEIKQNQQIERDMEHKARLKRQKKRKMIIAIAAVVIAALIPVFLVVGNKIETKLRYSMKEKEMTPDIKGYPTGGVIISEEIKQERKEETKKLKKTPSDIKGMSKYDKLQMGLNVNDGSDTDGDGLTDQEEIEIYDSDPLKCSTAGDLYSDGYKVENGMDLRTEYPYKGNSKLTSDDKVVTIEAKTPYDLGSVSPSPKDKTSMRITSDGMKVVDYTETAKNTMEGSPEFLHIHYCVADEFYKAYLVSGYDGDTIEVDLEKLAKALDVNERDLDVEAYAKDQNAKISIKEKDGVKIITIDRGENATEGSPFNAYIVYVVKKDSSTPFAIHKSPSGINGIKNIKGSMKDEYDENHGLIVICPPAACFLHTPPRIYCSEDATEDEKRILLAQATKVYQSVFYEPIWVKRPVCDESYITYATSSSIRKLYKLCGLFLGNKNKLGFDGSADVEGRIALLMYQNLGDFYLQTKTNEENALREEAEELEAFSLSDEFNFANFDSIYSDGGVCTGFARVTAEVYNNGRVKKPQGSFKDESGLLAPSVDEVAFDITELEACTTFFDRFLNDYNTSLNPLVVEDDEVMRMLTYYWADGNQQMYEKNDWRSFIIDQDKGEYLSWDTVENAVKYMSKHKALICCLSIGNTIDGGHAINLVGYTRYGKGKLDQSNATLDVEDLVVFDTYDSNCPQSIGALYCYKCRLPDSKSIVLYEYIPVAGYEMVSNYRSQFLGLDTDYLTPNADQMIMFAILNEDMESLNEKQWYD